MRSFSVGFIFSILCLSTVFAQSDRGTVTGTVADPAGAVVANAPIEARNVETGAIYPAASSETGNFTLSQLPAGTYELTVAVPGFKKYVRSNVVVQVAQTLRLDIALEVGSAAESVTVSEEVSLLKTESGELSHTISSQKLDDLPILGTGAQNSSTWGVRNTYSLTTLIPGTLFNSNTNIRVNGAVSNTQTIAIEGQDATDRFLPFSTVMTQPSADAVQEVAVQTSNFAAEFGQVGGGYFNMTIKSGTNQYHGTAYDYFVNEVFNAAQPYTNLKDVQRRNDFGFSVGGPLWVPKVYDGHNKTFFFLNLEYFRQSQIYNTTPQTVPTDRYRNGDFGQALTNRTLNTDPLGRPIMENAIYDPLTERTAPNGQLIRDAFPNNLIPAARLDPVALKIQALIPRATSSGLVNNIVPAFPSETITNFPAFKGDQQIGSKMKLSVYWSESSNIRQYSPGTGNADGLPDTITAARGNFIGSHTERMNFDYSITPTLLLHLGGGYQHLDFQDRSPTLNYDSYKELGLRGQTYVRNFPTINGLCTLSGTVCTGQGGMVTMGPNGQSVSEMVKPTFNTSATYVRGNHTYKAGAELRFEGYPVLSFTSAKGIYTFNVNQTGLPSTQGQNLAGGTTGFAYASFLMGMVNNGSIGNVTKARGGKSSFGSFIQDTWKVTRKFTLDYGLRWDYSTYSREQYGRAPNFSATTPNPTAGGRLGAPIFEGYGPGRCNCDFAHNYPYAIGPRIGAAYQITPKTVLRAGWGLVYTSTPNANLANTAVSSTPFTAPSPYAYAMLLRDGIPLTPDQYAWPNFSPGLYPSSPSAIGVSPMPLIDPNAGRPARQNQWSVGLQREIFRNLVVEGSYVANRGVWWQGNSLLNYNALSSQILSAYGLDINNPSDQTLLTSTIGSTTAIARGFNKLPYPGFPSNQTVAQSLRPFPQFTTVSAIGAPLGKTWYDSLQVKVTKRYSYGLDFSYAFTWQKELQMGAESDSVGPGGVGAVVNDVFNRGINKYLSGQSRPLVSVLSLNYRTPKLNEMAGNRILGYVVSEWQVGTVMQYASGLPIAAPTANNALNPMLFQSTFANRVAGQPLYTVDINCHCFDPNTTFVLNKNAWADPARGQFGTSAAYYNDYRQPRRPSENLNFGRTFKLVERVTMEIRAEFSNILNRAYFQTPVATNASATQTRNAQGQTTSGFGYINVQTPLAATFAAPGPRSGTVVARFRF
jgi:hypothetical protein